MARPPRSKTITVDPAASTDDRFSQMLEQLNSFMTDTQKNLDGGLTHENFQRQEKTVSVTTASFPLKISVSLPSRPRTVYPLQVVTKSGIAPSAAVDTSQWKMLDGTTLEITAMPGLSANSTYDVTLAIE